MENSETRKQLEALGYDVDQLIEQDKQLSKSRARNSFVCLCGHPVSRHTTDEEGNVYCKPARMFCHCKQIEHAVEAEDNRSFYRKTNNYGAEHALTRGMLSSITKGKEAIWVEANYKCMYPGCSTHGLDSGIQPALIELPSERNKLPGYPEGKLVTNHRLSVPSEYDRNLRDMFLCPEHLDHYILESR